MSANASAASITVTVKLINGDLFSLQVDPSLGLNGVADALTRFDSILFPKGITTISFTDEEQTTLINDTMLMVFVAEPLESIVHVDTFDWKGHTAYRLRIKADRTKSMNWLLSEQRKQYSQLFDICYYPSEKSFRQIWGGDSLEHCSVVVGKRFKRPATALKGQSRDNIILFRRDNVGLDQFDDEISRLPTLDERIDFSRFKLTDDAIQRISTLITSWISQNSL